MIRLGLLMCFSVQSNSSEIELCHALSSFCTVRLHANIHAVWTICCVVVREVCFVMMLSVLIVQVRTLDIKLLGTEPCARASAPGHAVMSYDLSACHCVLN